MRLSLACSNSVNKLFELNGESLSSWSSALLFPGLDVESSSKIFNEKVLINYLALELAVL